MKIRFWLVLSVFISIIFIKSVNANYSFKITIKHPFLTEHYDSLGNVISDSFARFMKVKPIIYRSEIDSVYSESETNDSGYAFFNFEYWDDEKPVELNDIIRRAIDFPYTDEAIGEGDNVTFKHMIIHDIDIESQPYDIEIVLPMTVTVDEFIVGDTTWFNICNIAVMNDMQVGEYPWPNWSDFETDGWNDYDENIDSNDVIGNNRNVAAHIRDQSDATFAVILGDISSSAESSEFQRAREICNLTNRSYIPIPGNHDPWPNCYHGFN